MTDRARPARKARPGGLAGEPAGEGGRTLGSRGDSAGLAKVQVRPAVAADVPAVAALVAASTAPGGAAASLVSPEAWAMRLQQPAQAVYLGQLAANAVGAPVLVAVGHLQVVLDEAELVDLWVLPGWRRRGVGRALLSGVGAELVARGVGRVVLEVRRDNLAARALYEGLGFVAYGLRCGYYAPRPGEIDVKRARDAILLHATLPFRVA